MRQRLAMGAASLAACALLTACAGADGTDRGAIRENVIEPGITAIDDAETLACDGDATTLRTALESYELLEGSPAPDEAALVAEGYLRSESELWDVVDGAIVAADPGCGQVPADVPAEEIVTEVEEAQSLSMDDMYALMSPDEIEQYGGPECATELAAIMSAGQIFVEREAREPGTLDDLAGDLEIPVQRWHVLDDTLVPTDGSGCVDFAAIDAENQCQVEARTLETAVEAFAATEPQAPAPSVSDLVEAGYLRPDATWAVDLVDGEVVAVAGGNCDGVDLG